MYVNPRLGIAIITLDVEEGTPLKRMKTPCNVLLSPVCPAQVIVRGEGHDIVFDAVHGQLPDGFQVIAVKDAAGAFPDTVEDMICRIIVDPYQIGDEPHVLDARLVEWHGGCPICGELTEDDLEGFDGDDDDGGDDPDENDDEDDEEPPVIDMPRRFVYDDIVKPGTN